MSQTNYYSRGYNPGHELHLRIPSLHLWPVLVLMIGVILGMGLGEVLEWMDQEPNRKELLLIKYTYCVEERVFKLISKIQNECKDLGTELGIDEDTLDSLDNSRKKRTEVCISILTKWKKRGDSDYDVTWAGLLEALKNAELGGVAKQLERALTLRANKDNSTLQTCDPPKWMKQEPNMTLLTLIKYTDCEGKNETFNLIDKIQNDCKHLGNVLDIEEETLNSFEDKTPLERCKSILQIWIQRGESRYEVTWNGLLEALNDSMLGGIGRRLEKALIFHANMEQLPQMCENWVGENLEWARKEPDMRQLAIIKYTNCVEFKERQFNLIMMIQNDCNYLGMVMGIEGIDMTRDSTTDNCKYILGEWIKRGTGHSHYEVTWAGLLEALEEAKLRGVAEKLEEVLAFYADNSTLKKCQNVEWMNQKPLHILHKLMNRRKVDYEWACNELLRALEDAELGGMAECLEEVLCDFFHNSREFHEC